MHMLSDLVRIKDYVIFKLGRKLGEYLISHESDPLTVVGHVTLRGIDDEGKTVPGTYRDGDNIITQTGREWMARLMSYSDYGTHVYWPEGKSVGSYDQPARADRIRYMGVGTGTQNAVPGVTALARPVEYQVGMFLAEVNVPPTYGFTSSTSVGTSVRYAYTFQKNEISLPDTVQISEIGLFTDGSPLASYAPGTRSRLFGVDGVTASAQPPMFYKAFEAFPKTKKFAVAAIWEVRF